MPFVDVKNKRAKALFGNCKAIIYLIVEVNKILSNHVIRRLISYISKYFYPVGRL